MRLLRLQTGRGRIDALHKGKPHPVQEGLPQVRREQGGHHQKALFHFGLFSLSLVLPKKGDNSSPDTERERENGTEI